jgi:hypothetical protein
MVTVNYVHIRNMDNTSMIPSILLQNKDVFVVHVR